MNQGTIAKSETIRESDARCRRPSLGLLIPLALGTGLRLAWILIVRTVPVSDFARYYNAALDLSQGRGLTMQGHPTAYMPVGWPGTLAGYFLIAPDSVMSVKLLNVALWAVTITVCYYLGVRTGGPTVGFLGALLVAVWPDFIVYTGMIASENLAIPLIALSVLWLARWGEQKSIRRAVAYAAAAGLALGYSVLVRPTGVLLPIVIAPLMLVLRRDRAGIAAASAFLVTAALLPGAWVLRNVVVIDAVVLSTNSGANLWIGANADADGSFVQPVDTDYSTVQAEVETSARLTAEASDWIRDNPGAWLALIPLKFRHLFGNPSSLRWAIVDVRGSDGTYPVRELEGAERVVVAAYERLGFTKHYYQTALWLLGAAGLVIGLLHRERTLTWISVYVVYWILLHLLLAFGHQRFMLSVAPLMCVAAAYAAISFAPTRRVSRLRG